MAAKPTAAMRSSSSFTLKNGDSAMGAMKGVGWRFGNHEVVVGLPYEIIINGILGLVKD